MGLGHIQKQVIKLGKEKGDITPNDLQYIWRDSSIIRARMGTLVFLGYFEKEDIIGATIRWKYKNKTK